ncbi:MAG: hypothetical protein ABWZ66_06940 [Pyrinomonadaceae bacterium]
MKSEEFNKNYEIDRKSKGVKAVPKGTGGYLERMTADGEPFNPENKYHFFDESTKAVRSTIGLRRVCNDWIGDFGLRIVEVKYLRANLSDALSYGQEYFRKEIQILQEKIFDFEQEKTELS